MHARRVIGVGTTVMPLVAIPLLAAALLAGGHRQPLSRLVGPVEGVYEYLPPLRGQAIAIQGRYTYFFGPADGSGPMVANAGTYAVNGDTISNTITFSTNPAEVGTSFRWVSIPLSGDTAEFRVVNAAGQVTIRGRSIKVR